MNRLRDRLRLLARCERGQALVETTILLPLVLTLLFGIVELGMYMYDYIQASNCAREAARMAAVRVEGAESPDYCISAAVQPTVTPANYETAPAGSLVTATVNAEHTWIVIGNLLPSAVLPNPMPLNASVTMRMEGQRVD